jgi:hypothetical protein
MPNNKTILGQEIISLSGKCRQIIEQTYGLMEQKNALTYIIDTI